MIHLKAPEEIEIMDRANRIVHTILDRLGEELAPGVVLRDLDRLAESLTKQMGGKPAFKGYGGFPASVCISVNDEVVHGIPGPRVIQPGDLVSLDFGVIVDGYYGDAARTFPVGDVDPEGVRLLAVTRTSLEKGVEQVRVGSRVSDVSHAVQEYAEGHGYSVVRDYVGHGIGRALHEEPQVPNFGEPGRGPRLQEGMVLAIEPMINEGGHGVTVDEDGWTVRTADGKRSAHFEYSVAVTENGPRILGIEGA
ncbi:MAG: type I methionyl aminopeptidase [Acidobacteriota bacterium]